MDPLSYRLKRERVVMVGEGEKGKFVTLLHAIATHQLFILETTGSIKIVYLICGLCVRRSFDSGMNRGDEFTFLAFSHHSLHVYNP